MVLREKNDIPLACIIRLHLHGMDAPGDGFPDEITL